MTNQSPTPQAVAAEVRAEMGRQRKSQADLARALGVHPATAGRRFDGSSPFDLIELVKVAGWLGVTVADILSRAEQSATPAEVA